MPNYRLSIVIGLGTKLYQKQEQQLHIGTKSNWKQPKKQHWYVIVPETVKMSEPLDEVEPEKKKVTTLIGKKSYLKQPK